MPDLVVTVEQILGEGDLVAVRWTARGTNTGTGNGLQATGKRLEVGGTTIFRVVDGRIVEEWNSIDELGLMRQLGAIP
jgi:predicted ester cyclase